jgi:hypothetical protein
MAICNVYQFPAQAYPEQTDTNTQCWALPITTVCGTFAPLYPSCDPCKPLPFVRGDVLRYQWQLPDRLNDWPNPQYGIRLTDAITDWLIQVDVVDIATGTVAQAVQPDLQGWVGYLTTGERFQTVFFDTSSAPACFALRVSLNKGGYTVEEYYTDTYQESVCDDTILITAVPSGASQVSCFGAYTATLEAANNSGQLTVLSTYQQYIPQIRVYGDLQILTFDLSQRETTPLGATKRLTVSERWQIVFAGLSPQQAQRLATCFAADYVDVERGDTVVRLIPPGQLSTIAGAGTDFYGPLELSTPPCIQQSGCD